MKSYLRNVTLQVTIFSFKQILYTKLFQNQFIKK